MDLARHISPDQILVGIEVNDKWELLDRMIAAVGRSPIVASQPDQVKSRIGPLILAREREHPSGIANGLAYPHARVPGFRGFVAALAVLSREIEYETLDSTAVRLVFMAVTPLETPMVGMQTMSLFAGLMSQADAREFLLTQTDPAKVYEFLVEQAPAFELVVTARQLMRPLTVKVAPDTPIRVVSQLMCQYGTDAVPVLDVDDRIVGEVTSDILFKKGLPDFFSQLTNVAFMRHFDPFEAYFENEAKAKAGDAMSADFAALPEDATLMEVVYLFSVRKYPKIYVERDRRVVGVIDRAVVVDRILNV
ncbi:MAG: PTS sugar transporter subunit IIA [Candidatus Eisenbacteria bacterium]|nr:PTS sugar transporter subunit IIA [Candidatus Eisenbacteria bacterium]